MHRQQRNSSGCFRKRIPTNSKRGKSSRKESLFFEKIASYFAWILYLLLHATRPLLVRVFEGNPSMYSTTEFDCPDCCWYCWSDTMLQARWFIWSRFYSLEIEKRIILGIDFSMAAFSHTLSESRILFLLLFLPNATSWRISSVYVLLAFYCSIRVWKASAKRKCSL